MTEFRAVSTNELEEPLFDLRFHRDDRKLQTSVRNYGVMNPISVVEREGKLRVLDGIARLEIARGLGLETVPCMIFDMSEDKEAFIYTLERNAWARTFNLIEKALLLKAANKLFGGLKIPRTFWDTVGIKENIRVIHQHKELLKLPLLVQKYAVNNNIAPSVILVFSRFPVKEVEYMANHLFQLPLNQNKLAEIISSIQDISKREEILPSILLDEIFSELADGLSAVQKEQALRKALLRRRNPHYETQLSEFVEKVNHLSLDANTRVNPAPYFEDDYVEIQTRIYSKEDLENLVDALKNDTWADIIKDSK